MATVDVYYNPLDGDSLETFPVPDGTHLAEWMLATFPDGFNNTIRVFLCSEELDLDDLGYELEGPDHVVILVMPGTGAGIATALISAAVSAAVGLVIGLIFKPSQPKGLTTEKESPVYSISGTQNRARLGEPMPVHYGQPWAVPDFASAPYTFFESGANAMFVDQLMVVGMGEYDAISLNDIRIGDTPVSGMQPGTVQIWVFSPSEHQRTLGVIEAAILQDLTTEENPAPLPFYENVFTSPEVQDWQFNDDQSEEDAGTWYQLPGTSLGATQGDYGPELEDEPGKLRCGDTATIRAGDTVQLRNTANNNGDGFVVASVQPSIAGHVNVFEDPYATPSAQYINQEDPLPGATEYRLNADATNMKAGPFRVQKVGDLSKGVWCDLVFPGGLYEAVDSGSLHKRSVTMTLHWQEVGNPDSYDSQSRTFTARKRSTIREQIKGPELTPGVYEAWVTRDTPLPNNPSRFQDDVHLVGLKGIIHHSSGAGTVYAASTLIAVRMKATNGLDSAARSRLRIKVSRKLDSGDSRNPVRIIRDIYTNPDYGMSRTEGDLNQQELGLLEAEYDLPEGPRFHGGFDQRGTGFEAMQSVASLVAGQIVHNGSLLTLVPDEVQDIRTALFTSGNTAPGTMSIDYTWDTTGAPDGVQIEYRDPDSWDPAYITDPVDATNPETFTLFGCADSGYAQLMGNYLRQARVKRRRVCRLGTEMEGLLPRFGDRIGVSHPMPEWGESGVLAELTDLSNFRVDHDLTWTGSDVIILRDETGRPTDILNCTEGVTPADVVLAAPSPISLFAGAGQEPTSYAFGPANNVVRDFQITRLNATGPTTVEVEAQAYDPTIYENGPLHMRFKPLSLTFNPEAGWVKVYDFEWTFSAPPGTADAPLEFTSLTPGQQYRLFFTSAASTGYGACYFSPGETAQQTAITGDGDWDITFTAQNIDGISRIVFTDVTGVDSVNFTKLLIYEL